MARDFVNLVDHRHLFHQLKIEILHAIQTNSEPNRLLNTLKFLKKSITPSKLEIRLKALQREVHYSPKVGESYTRHTF